VSPTTRQSKRTRTKRGGGAKTPHIVRAPKSTAADDASSALEDDPLWYKHAVIYELHVRAFADSNNDGIGDFKGLTEKLDYLQDLGVTAIWLLPFYPSPLRDDGYDIARYTAVNPAYGTMRDVKRFIREAHRRGIRVITELVLNHTSDQHRWFQRARQAPPRSPERDFYVWTDDPSKYAGTRIIFQDFEASNWTWDPVAKAYYWHRFYSHQPDLNFDNPAVHEALFEVLDFWFEAGVDGMRLDAVPYLYEREGTNCENLPETHEFLKKLREHIDSRFEGRMFLAEANQWPEDAAAYFGEGDECHMNFHFPLMPRLFMSVQMEDRFPILDILDQTPQVPENCQWAIFLRNHDELTLEMVTDEERDYMYRVFADDRQARINLGIRRRLAPLLQNNRRKIELMNALLLSMPGTPVIYYGDEIGMGDNIYLGDRDGVRTPMQWSADRNAGFSRANPQQLYLPAIIDPEYRFEAINVEAQLNNPTSLLWWMKRLIALRKRYPVFGDGELEFLHPANHKVLTFLRKNEHETMLVVANLSRFSQAAEIDLSDYHGRYPVELFGHTAFPPIGDLPYFITLGPHAFYWFSLEHEPPHAGAVRVPPTRQPEQRERPVIEVGGDFARWFQSARAVDQLEDLLARDIPRRRWFRSKARKIRHVSLVDRIPVRVDAEHGELSAMLGLVEFDFVEGDPELYAVPLALASPGHTAFVFGTESPAVIAEIHNPKTDERWLLYDAMVDQTFCTALLDMILRKRRAKGRNGRIEGAATREARSLVPDAADLDVHISRAEQSNSSVIYGDQFILKLYRSVAPGVNPDLEVSRHLTESAKFESTPAFRGAVEYTPASGRESYAVGMLQSYVANEGDGWGYTLDELGHFYERLYARASGAEAPTAPPVRESVVSLAHKETPGDARELIGPYLNSVELLGRRTAEMHAGLADGSGDAAFKPESFTQLYLRSLYQSLRNSARRSLQMLRQQRLDLPDDVAADADDLIARESELVDRLREVSRKKLKGMRTRCHGDYHLGQVLWTGRDFIIIDFEGEPARALSERRLKWTPLRDVAGMLRSFQYAAYTALRRQVEQGAIAPETESTYGQWADFWEAWVGATYLRSYLEAIRTLRPDLLPDDDEGLRALLDAWLLEKAMYEVRYELNNRPDWIRIPLRGVLEVLNVPPNT